MEGDKTHYMAILDFKVSKFVWDYSSPQNFNFGCSYDTGSNWTPKISLNSMFAR